MPLFYFSNIFKYDRNFSPAMGELEVKDACVLVRRRKKIQLLKFKHELSTSRCEFKRKTK